MNAEKLPKLIEFNWILEAAESEFFHKKASAASHIFL
jgi:hypothetical protein